MKLGIFEIFLLVVAAALLLFLILWMGEEVSRWWKTRHLKKNTRRHSNPTFFRRK